MKSAMFCRMCIVVVMVPCGVNRLEGQEPHVVRPLRITRVAAPWSQIDEGSVATEPKWIVLHQFGLRIVDVHSGAEREAFSVARRIVVTDAHYWLTRNGKCFGIALPGAPTATIRRVSDCGIIAELNSEELFGIPHWMGQFDLGEDGTYLLAVARETRGSTRGKLVRVDFQPQPHIAKSREVGLSRSMFATPDPDGIVVLAPSGATSRARSGGWLWVFDHQLELQHKEKIVGPTTIAAAIDVPNPLIALRSVAGDNGSPVKGPPQWMLGELARDKGDAARAPKSALVSRFTANEWIMTAAFSPDGKWLVTSRDEALPTLDIRSTASGQLHRKIHIEGGRHELPSHQIISRMAFSLSGRYLCASDVSNAYLLDFQKLIESPTSTGDADSRTEPGRP